MSNREKHIRLFLSIVLLFFSAGGMIMYFTERGTVERIQFIAFMVMHFIASLGICSNLGE